MKIEEIHTQECDYYIAERIGDILKITFKENRMLYSTDLGFRDKIVHYLDFVSKSDLIKVVLLINPCDESRSKEYTDFYKLVENSKLSEGDVLRMYRTFDQLILKIVESDKFFISVDCGKLLPQLFDVSFACDYRIVTDTTTIHNTFLKIGLLPKGGAAYFLKKRLGHIKAFEILLSDKGINANEGLQFGIVNMVVPFEKLEEASMLSAKHFAKVPATTLSGIKRLLNYSMKDLADYLEFENQELINILTPFTWGFKRPIRSGRPH